MGGQMGRRKEVRSEFQDNLKSNLSALMKTNPWQGGRIYNYMEKKPLPNFGGRRRKSQEITYGKRGMARGKRTGLEMS